MNLAWSPAAGHQINLRSERSIDQLSFNSFAAFTNFSIGVLGRGNPDIQPEKTWLFEARYEWRFAQKGFLQFRAAHREIDDVLGTVVIVEEPSALGPGGTFDVVRNTGPARRDSLEASGALPLDHYGLTDGLLTGRLIRRWSEVQDPITGETRRLPRGRALEWRVGLSQNIQSLKVTWSLNASNGNQFSSYSPRRVSITRFGPFFNATISYRPRPNLDLTVSVNVRPERREERTVFDAPRDHGSVAYVERSRNSGVTTFQLKFRRSF